MCYSGGREYAKIIFSSNVRIGKPLEFLNLEETLDFLWHQSLRDEQIRQGNKLVAFEEARDPLLKILVNRQN